MATVLSFRSEGRNVAPLLKSDAMMRRGKLPLSVVSSSLPSGEGLPLLVHRDTWVPLSLAMRWAVLQRRYECAEATLRSDLNGLRYVYAWGGDRFAEGLEARLEEGPLDFEDLVSLRDYLLHPEAAVARRLGGSTSARAAGVSAGKHALAAKAFLAWAMSPASRNQRGAEPRDAQARIAQQDAVLGPLARRAGDAGVGEPLNEDAAKRITHLLAPVADARGQFLRPLRWHPQNPFRATTRLRNWLMWCLAQDCGLRVGELLALRASDFPVVRGIACVAVVRRPDAPEDTRRKRPQAKTLERVLPIGPHAEFALRAYLTERPPFGRRRGSPYLFTASTGQPLSVNAADRVTKLLARSVAVRVHWHALRHAWADDIARGVLKAALVGKGPSSPEAETQKALLIEQLRLMGGWSVQSTMPMHYARRALKEYADASLRVRQEERAQRIIEYRRDIHDHEVSP